MVSKVLKRKEVELGFVHIPVKNRTELMGDMPPPFDTKLNDLPAKVDKYGRLWSDYLKNRYSVNTQVTISKKCEGFQITTFEQKQENPNIETTQQQEIIISKTIVSTVSKMVQTIEKS